MTPNSTLNYDSPRKVYTDLVSSGATWKYLDNGTNQGTAWRDQAFNDSAWPSGTAEFGYGDGNAPDERPEVTVIGYGPDANQKYVTTYFRRQFTLTNAVDISGIQLDLLRDDGAVVYLNGTEIYRNSMPEGNIAFSTLALTNSDESTRVKVSLDAAKALLLNGANTLAVEIHQAQRDSDDVSFDLRLTALRQRHGVFANDVDRDAARCRHRVGGRHSTSQQLL